VLVTASILVVWVAFAGMFIWYEVVHGLVPVLGLTLLVLGATGVTLYFRSPGADTMRWAWRGPPVLVAAAFLGWLYLDRCVQPQIQFLEAVSQGAIAAKARDWQASADAYSEAIRLNPSSAKAHHERGVALGFQGEHDRAIEDFNVAIQLDPNNAWVRYHRGVAYSKKRDHDSAMTDFDEAIRLDPAFARAYRARSSIYAKKGDAARAKADKQKAAELEKAGEEKP
jgi:tetratricopeptide (TPR) repeat protein